MSDTRDRLQDAARTIAAILPPGTGFLMMAFDFKPGGRIEYVSNAQRSDVCNAMREFIEKTTAENYATHIKDKEFEIDPRVLDLNLWAWVGEDEFGNAVGLKQAFVPAGCIPLVSISQEKIAQPYIREQMQGQVKAFGKPISLVKFNVERIEDQLT